MSAAERTLHIIVARPLLRCLYRVTTHGLRNLPQRRISSPAQSHYMGGCNRAATRLPASDSLRHRPGILSQTYFCVRSCGSCGCIPIDIAPFRILLFVQRPNKSPKAEIVCLFPEGQLERAGTLLRLQRGYELIARHANAASRSGLARSTLGLDLLVSRRTISSAKLPKRIPYRITIAFGKPLKRKIADIATVREELLKLGEFCFSRRRALDRHLAEECVRGLKRQTVRDRSDRRNSITAS